MEEELYFNRDLSWLGFNDRVLMEAAKAEVPLLERIKFLSIFSSNLDEFYRVRIPVLMAINILTTKIDQEAPYEEVKRQINWQQEKFGDILTHQILPELEKQAVVWVYNQPIPDLLVAQVNEVFFIEILAFINPLEIEGAGKDFFAQNNELYQAVILTNEECQERIEFINIPAALPRFYEFRNGDQRYVVFIEDIIKQHLSYLFPTDTINGVYNVKVTRDAELRLEEEVDTDIVIMLEKELAKRDFGFATRFLCSPGMPLRYLYKIIYALALEKASIVIGGIYHNLKDLNEFPRIDKSLEYQKWPALNVLQINPPATLFAELAKKDLLIHVPYESYHPVLRFFNEAAHHPNVEAIYCTLYRVANSSKIVQALMNASTNGKKVTVMLELKARFDEANNIKWARQMKAAGIRIIYSSISFKVHAKVALIKFKDDAARQFLGLLATGNFNETTAKFYTDHILLTAHQPMLQELELLFGFLTKKKKKPATEDFIPFKHLLVAQFNLHTQFLALIDREIRHALEGHPTGITIKLNNLEERVLIDKLYEASRAGVKIQLLIRSICCLVPGIIGQSENITVKRIVGRYLEHGRVFIFYNNGAEEMFMGSADWMNRNIYNRIEVCFPIYDPQLKSELKEIIFLQLAAHIEEPQAAIYNLLKEKQNRRPDENML